MGYKADVYKKSRNNPVNKFREDAELDFGVYVGEVIVRPKDDTHSGRIPVYIPMLAKDRDDPNGYFNCYWSSPFAGSTPSAKLGPNIAKYADTMKSYGMWMVPPDPGNFVLVIFGDGKKKFPIIIGCLFPDQLQFMVPGNAAGTIFGANIPAPGAEKNKRDPNLTHSVSSQRPLNLDVARSILKQGLILDPIRGTTTSSARRESPSEVFGILTPGPDLANPDTGVFDGTNRRGGHSFVMDDDLDQRHIRLRTALGNQILLDDTNGIIYIINRDGTAWLELGEDGKVNIFSELELNIRSRNVNIRADDTLNIEAGNVMNINAGVFEPSGGDSGGIGNININASNSISSLVKNYYNVHAKTDVSILADSEVKLESKSNFSVTSGSGYALSADGVSFSSSGEINSIATGRNNVRGATVHLNDGGSAESPSPAQPLQRIATTIFSDPPMAYPEFDYDEQNVTESDNPFPTEGERPGESTDVESICGIITTREPWFGHFSTSPAEAVSLVTTSPTQTQSLPANALPGDNFPAPHINSDGVPVKGVSFNESGDTTTADYTPMFNQAPESVSSPAAFGKGYFESAKSQDLSSALSNLSGSFPSPTPNAAGQLTVGMGHVLKPEELESKTLAFGNGNLYNPLSDTVEVDTPSGKFSLKDVTQSILPNIVSNPAQASNYGLQKFENGFKHIQSGIILYPTTQAMPRSAASELLRHDIANTARTVSQSLSGAKTRMNRNQFNSITSFAHSIGFDNWNSSDVKTAILSGKIEKVPQLMMNWRYKKFIPSNALSSRRSVEGRLFSMPDSFNLTSSDKPISNWAELNNVVKAAQTDFYYGNGF